MNLLIPQSPGLKTLLGKVTNFGPDGEIRKKQKNNNQFLYRGIKLEYKQLFEEHKTEEIQNGKQSNIEENVKDARNNYKIEEIFSTSATYNVEEENLERDFRNTRANVIIENK